MKNHFKILGVHRASEEEEINAAYKKLAALLHPDTGGGDTHAFVDLSVAKKVLTTPLLRKEYLKTLDREFDLCAACGGTGCESKQVSFTERLSWPCPACDGAARIL